MDQCLKRRRRGKKKLKRGLDKLLQDLKPTFKALDSCTHWAYDQQLYILLSLLTFIKDSRCVIKRCTKPDRQEFRRSALATAVGLLIMGFLGFVIKLMHIPITNRGLLKSVVQCKRYRRIHVPDSELLSNSAQT
ncbi:uncharacterized protein LOC122322594 [Drosophila grimshawi]|uniref:uncharacterized protein LOC122322594 n=1 Tax=Drosophila grimshawi TaxID=7222 RepID=UPI001C935997|nr:uncharacterized protein LOC122322594 [Drosophila grimshawi]